MKKLFSAAATLVTSFMLSVTAFAGAPLLFEQPSEIINTGGEGMIFIIIAIVAAVLAFIGGVVFFLTGSKK